ncbi:MAG: hypothetical protein WA830_03925 [Candidatus Sulfotelmatobacter sp.]
MKAVAINECQDVGQADDFQKTDMNTAESRSGPRVRDAVGAGWKIPALPPRLEDARLLEYRYPTELPMLWLALATLALLLVGAVVFKHKAIMLGIVGIWLTMIFTSLQAVTYNPRSSRPSTRWFSNSASVFKRLRRGCSWFFSSASKSRPSGSKRPIPSCCLPCCSIPSKTTNSATFLSGR